MPTILNRWTAEGAAGQPDADLLLYRSRLLGSDLAITNFGGGNTSAKIRAADPLSGEVVDVLWVKGSGGDLRSIHLDGFATLYQRKVTQLEARYRGLAHEDEMVDYLPHCAFNLNPRAASIDTPLHAFLPHRHVDHVHPDSVIAFAAARDSKAIVAKVFGDEVGWLPWQRPGFDLALRLRDLTRERPQLRGVVLAGHGLIAWGETSESCYRNTIEIVNRASACIESAGKAEPFGRARAGLRTLSAEERRAAAARVMSVLRPRLQERERKLGHFSDAPAILEFVNSVRLGELAALGTSCPDHFLRTKVLPLVLDTPLDAADLEAQLDARLAIYRADYVAYHERHRTPASPPVRDPNPVVFLVPGVGMITFAKDKTTARLAAEFYGNAVNVMRGAEALDAYVGLDPGEAFAIEYWALEEAKLKRMPAPRPLHGRVAYITGAASGIGRATAAGLLADGACVVLTDINEAALHETERKLRLRFGADPIRSHAVDVTDQASIAASIQHLLVEFGGLDILVASAGIASAASVEETTLEIWRRNFDVLATGYFLVSRAAFPLLKPRGGSIVFVGSKNALVASPNASAYCSAKAAELHLARCLALEGAPFGIRVNTVNPDAVIQGSSIWDGDWRRERAAAYGIREDQLEAHYAKRSLLQRAVLPEDIADAVRYFAGDASSKSTGNILNVDAGHAGAFVR
jgi:rhamnulose-1-phosphate aldolase/alcohol dehydrogenase